MPSLIHDEDGPGAPRPRKAHPPSAGFIQAPSFIEDVSGARASRTSPQVARGTGRTQKWDKGGGLGSGSSSIRRSRLRALNGGLQRDRGQRKGGHLARRFRGEGHHKVDGKGRVSIPASFRRVLEAGDPDWTDGLTPGLVIVYGDHRRAYLECYTVQAINQVDAQIEALPRGSMERRMLQRLFHGQSFPTSVDETGRLVLPAKLRAKVGLGTEAFFIAAGDTFQIWKPETYDTEELAKTEAWLDGLPDDFDPLILLDRTRET